jgi:hypothetical protein
LSINKYEIELNGLNASINQKVGQTDFLELSTLYDKFLKKLSSSEINISLYEEEQINSTMLRSGDLGSLLGVFTFDTSTSNPAQGIVYGKDQVITKTTLEYSESGFVEAEISCGTGTTGTGSAAVSIIRAASNTNKTSEHLHYWTNTNGSGNNVEWKFYGKFYNRSFTSYGTVKVYENGLPYPDPLPIPTVRIYNRVSVQFIAVDIVNPAPGIEYRWEITGGIHGILGGSNTHRVFHASGELIHIKIYIGDNLVYSKTIDPMKASTW